MLSFEIFRIVVKFTRRRIRCLLIEMSYRKWHILNLSTQILSRSFHLLKKVKSERLVEIYSYCPRLFILEIDSQSCLKMPGDLFELRVTSNIRRADCKCRMTFVSLVTSDTAV